MSKSAERPAAEGIEPGHFAPSPVEPGHMAPCPRRVRGMVGGEWVLDSSAVIYYWEHPYYPQYLIPLSDIGTEAVPEPALRSLTGVMPGHRLVAWDAIDRWFEEDEEVFVHPRSPYTRADAVRSNRRVVVKLDGAVIADAPACVSVFETGLPPRHYLDKTSINWSLLTPSTTVSRCPYKGTTSQYWNATVNGQMITDIAWSYEFTTPALTAIAGLVAFYDDKVGVAIESAPNDVSLGADYSR